MAVLATTADIKYKICDSSSEQTDNSETSYCKVDHLSQDVKSSGFERVPRCCKRSTAAVVLVVSLGINVLAVVWLLTTVTFKHKADDSPRAEARVFDVHENTVCTDCSLLGVHPDRNQPDLHELHVHHVTGSSFLCCLRNAEGLWRLASMFATRFHTEAVSDALTSSPRTKQIITGAHLNVNSEDLNLHPPSLSWTKNYGQYGAYSSGNIGTDGRKLHITRPGLYHVYSFFTFKTKQRRLRPEIIVHTVNRVNSHLPNLGPSVLLMAKKTMPEVSEKFVTSFLSASIRLRDNDDLFVHVSNMSYIYNYPPSNFFGLYYLGT
ncbi:uncharacterized protein LOC124282365 [Haliotis rubra]|uniref:uncharacterized protein LOC124282365 n=1 Tax=Haliotis rubra TaxID=36100 RepID=UPI001EE4F807|nr:uncharacterized protein LOC124282365 [Haliotis rubra]